MKRQSISKMKGQMAVHVTGFGSRTPDEPVFSHHVDVHLRRTGNRFWLDFQVDHPWLPVSGKLTFNLLDFRTDRFDFSIYRMEAIQSEPDAFLLLVNYCWKNIRSMEFFHGVAKFAGKAPTELYPRSAPV